MNKEQTKEAIKVMQAFVDGKDIQIEVSPGIWQYVNDPNWAWNDIQRYRIKPEPREFWLILYKDGTFRTFDDATAAQVWINGCEKSLNYIPEIIHVREITD